MFSVLLLVDLPGHAKGCRKVVGPNQENLEVLQRQGVVQTLVRLDALHLEDQHGLAIGLPDHITRV